MSGDEQDHPSCTGGVLGSNTSPADDDVLTAHHPLHI